MVLVPELERVDDKWKRTEMDGFACGSLGLHVSLPARSRSGLRISFGIEESLVSSRLRWTQLSLRGRWTLEGGNESLTHLKFTTLLHTRKR